MFSVPLFDKYKYLFDKCSISFLYLSPSNNWNLLSAKQTGKNPNNQCDTSVHCPTCSLHIGFGHWKPHSLCRVFTSFLTVIIYDWFYSFLISECFYEVVHSVSNSVAGLCVALVLSGSCDVFLGFFVMFRWINVGGFCYGSFRCWGFGSFVLCRCFVVHL